MWQAEENELPDLDSREKTRRENYDWMKWQLKKDRQMPLGMSMLLSDNCIYISFQPPTHWLCGNYSTPISLYENPIEFKKLVNVGYRQYFQIAEEKRKIYQLPIR